MSRALLDLERFQSLSEAMACAAEAQEWAELARTELERSTLLATLPNDLAAKLPTAEHAQCRAILDRCQLLNQQTQKLVDERQKALRILLREPDPVS